jgi:type IV pilus assembly protein PilY1
MIKNSMARFLFIWMLLIPMVFVTQDAMYGAPKLSDPNMADYTAYPPFVVGSSSKPNVMILMSNDHTNFYKGYNDTIDMDDDSIPDTTYKNTVEYYGYFDPDKCYTYAGSEFNPSANASNHYCTGSWSGNFMNWVAMAHADFVRKALTGGKRVTDSATKTTLKRANIFDSAHSWNKVYSGTDINQLTPFSSTYTFRNSGTTLYARSGSYPSWTDTSLADSSYDVEVEVCNSSIGLETNCRTYQDVGVTTYKPAGMIVKYAAQIRFGLMTYSVDSSTYDEQGGILRRNVQDVVDEINPNGVINSGISDGIIRYVNNFTEKGWDPIGELYYEAVRYFMDLSATSEYGCDILRPTDDGFPVYCSSGSRLWEDPLQSYCQKNYIIIVNDEYPSKDHDRLPSSSYSLGVTLDDSGINTDTWTDIVGSLEGINNTMRDVGNVFGGTQDDTCNSKLISGLGDVKGICPAEPNAEGTFNIAGLAYYAHTQDLRTGATDYEETQTIKTYSIAFRASPGGYQVPPAPMNQLWLAAKYGGFEDRNGNSQFDAGTDIWDKDGDGDPDNFFTAEKGGEFENAISSIFADILESASSGTSASVIATTGEGEGTIYQAYFRPKLTVGADELTWLGYVQSLFVDSAGNIREDSDLDNQLDATDYILVMQFNTTTGASEVNKYADSNNNKIPESGELVSGSPFPLTSIKPIWEAGEVLWDTAPANRTIKTSTQDTCTSTTPCTTIDFTTTNKSTLRPYLRAEDDDEAEAIIRYIRGEDNPTVGSTSYTYRPRTMTVGVSTNTWKLGDVVYSTPTPVTRPAENLHTIYGDATYGSFRSRYLNRRHVVYTGANDGMLHAFNAGCFNETEVKFYTDVDSSGNCVNGSHSLGEELMAFVPQSLLPHLKWLTDTSYTHVYYVDQKPKILDARIFTEEAVCASNGREDATCIHPYGWGTVLIGGMRYGGREISYKDSVFGNQAKTFYSAYFAIDITNPEDSASYGKLLWTYTDTTGDLNMTTSYPAAIRVGDRGGTGSWFTIFGSGPTDYVGSSTKSGKVYVVNLKTGVLERKFVDETILEDRAFMADPVTVDVDLDYEGDIIYIGNTFCVNSVECTSSNWRGKMYRISTDEDTDPDNWKFPSLLYDPLGPITSPPSIALDRKANLWIYFGTGRYLHTNDNILDGTESWSFFGVKDTCKPWLNPSCTTTVTNMFDASNVEVCLGGTDISCDLNADTWADIISSSGSKDGWLLDFPNAGERNLSKPLILGGLAVWTTYKPSVDQCVSEGTSYIYATFYTTGTAYKNYIFDQTGDRVLRSKSLGSGMPSSVSAMITSNNTMMGFVQNQKGIIMQEEGITPFSLKSGSECWRQESLQ